MFTIRTVCLALLFYGAYGFYMREDKTKCPQVKPARNLDLHEMLGTWYVVQYYATSEEEVSYKCMRAILSMPTENMEVEMNVTFSFLDDPESDVLSGNITWGIPEPSQPAHWIHQEESYEGVYNTYVLDSVSAEWCLLLHCAEKPKSPRYLTSLIMGRNTTLPPVVISYLRDKLPRYDIALEYMFPMKQTECGDPSKALHYSVSAPGSPGSGRKHSGKRHPLRPRGRRSRPNKAKREQDQHYVQPEEYYGEE